MYSPYVFGQDMLLGTYFAIGPRPRTGKVSMRLIADAYEKIWIWALYVKPSLSTHAALRDPTQPAAKFELLELATFILLTQVLRVATVVLSTF